MRREALRAGHGQGAPFPARGGGKGRRGTEFVYLQGDGLDGREILALRAADAAAAAHLKEQLDGYLEQRRRETQNYLPEVYQLLSKASN